MVMTRSPQGKALLPDLFGLSTILDKYGSVLRCARLVCLDRSAKIERAKAR
jgi:hypothetical protein